MTASSLWTMPGRCFTGLKIFYYHRDQIGQWGYYEAIVVVGVYALFNGFIEAVRQPNMSRIIEQIRLGTFDFVLLKPDAFPLGFLLVGCEAF